jgi:hypothetical protein
MPRNALPLTSFFAPTAVSVVREVAIAAVLLVVVVLLISPLTGAGST